MPISDIRWKSITPSAYAWEQDALHFVRERLPDADPWRVWSNFEFISGMLRGDSMTWVVEHQGRAHTHDNPLLLTNRKAMKLASLLKGQKAAKDIRIPFIEPLVFLSHEEMHCHLQDAARTKVTVRDRENPSAYLILGALSHPSGGGARGGLGSRQPRPRYSFHIVVDELQRSLPRSWDNGKT